ncbi:MAG: hypothetical protein ABEK02_00525 [Haloquadratum sp.]
MRHLRTCDFCGDDAAGAFEVVPPELAPTAAEQRRVALCEDCRATLEHLLEPLLSRLDAPDDGGAAATETDEGETTGTETRGFASDASQSDSPLDPLSDDGATSGESSPSGAVTGDPDDGDAVSWGEVNAPSPAESEAVEESEPASESTAEEPEDFRTVMRLLGNREFPVDRAEIVDVAAGAYDLDERHVEEILEYAVDREVLVDDGGTLTKP